MDQTHLESKDLGCPTFPAREASVEGRPRRSAGFDLAATKPEKTKTVSRLLTDVVDFDQRMGAAHLIHLSKYSEDLNNEHLNNELSLVRYSDVRYSNGSSVYRPPFEYRSGIQMVV